MKRILVDARLINSSGIGTVIKNILPALCENFETFVLGNYVDLKNLKKHNNFEIIKNNSGIYSLTISFFYLFLPKVDLVWVPHFNRPFFCRSKKIVVTIHDVFHLDFISNFSFLQKIIIKLFYTLAVYKSSLIITDSFFTKKRLRFFFKNLKEKKINVVYLSANDKFQLITEYKPFGSDYFLFVGNIKPHKGLTILVDAFSKLSVEKQKRHQLILLGRKENFYKGISDELLNKIEKNPNIILLGRVSDKDLISAYQNAICLVQPSLYEGFGLPPLEAMKAQTPAICSDIEVFREIYHDSLLYFKSLDSNSLYEQLLRIINNNELRNDLIKKGIKKASEFSWKKSQSEYVRLFNEVIDKP